MSNVQVKMMKSVFENYKTPTMPECLDLGNNIGLQKRVVQVWFQNARAKWRRMNNSQGMAPGGGGGAAGAAAEGLVVDSSDVSHPYGP